jgi:hypothetical protein
VESPNGTAGRFVAHSGLGRILQGNSGSNQTQVFSIDASGNGYFAGNVYVTGNVSKGSGSFKIVGTDGQPHDIQVAQTGGEAFDAAAVRTVKLWRFEPARCEGQVIPMRST